MTPDEPAPPLIPAYVATILRAVIAASGGYIVQQGWLSADDLEKVTGGLMILGATVWGLVQKHNAQKALKKAIAAPAGLAE